MHVDPLLGLALRVLAVAGAHAVLPHERLAERLAAAVAVPRRHLDLVLVHRHQVDQPGRLHQRLAQLLPVGHAQDQAREAADHVAPVPVLQLRPGADLLQDALQPGLPGRFVVAGLQLHPRPFLPAAVEHVVHGAEGRAAAQVGAQQAVGRQRLGIPELTPGPRALLVERAVQQRFARPHERAQVVGVDGELGHRGPMLGTGAARTPSTWPRAAAGRCKPAQPRRPGRRTCRSGTDAAPP